MMRKPSPKQESVAEIKQALLKRFQTMDVKLKDISKELLDLSPRTAAEKAAKCCLPFPTHRLRPRAPWLVTIDDLASAIWSARRQAKQDWESVQTH
jgi:hypothetical protein